MFIQWTEKGLLVKFCSTLCKADWFTILLREEEARTRKQLEKNKSYASKESFQEKKK